MGPLIWAIKDDPNIGYYLTDPHTEEEQKLLDEFVKYQENEEEQSVYIDPELLKKVGAV